MRAFLEREKIYAEALQGLRREKRRKNEKGFISSIGRCNGSRNDSMRRLIHCNKHNGCSNRDKGSIR